MEKKKKTNQISPAYIRYLLLITTLTNSIDKKDSYGYVVPQGMILLTLSAALPSLKPAPCPSDSTLPCPSATTAQLAVLYLGLYLIALGNGGIKPNVSSLGADQFDESYEKERKHMSSFFNWYYFIISIGSLLSVTVFVYIQVRTYLCPSKLHI